MIVCERMLGYNWVDCMGKIIACGRRRIEEAMVVADRYAGKRCRNSSNLSLRAFKERSFGVIGIAFFLEAQHYFSLFLSLDGSLTLLAKGGH